MQEQRDTLDHTPPENKRRKLDHIQNDGKPAAFKPRSTICIACLGVLQDEFILQIIDDVRMQFIKEMNL